MFDDFGLLAVELIIRTRRRGDGTVVEERVASVRFTDNAFMWLRAFSPFEPLLPLT